MTDRPLPRQIRIVLVGPVPPPPGGVASSIASVRDALQAGSDVDVVVLSWRQLWRLPSIRPDIVHFNFSDPRKRLVASIIGQLAGARVIHTIHGNAFDVDARLSRAILRNSDGFIVLNHSIKERFRGARIGNVALMSPILAQGPTAEASGDAAIETLLSATTAKIATVYAHRREYIGERDLYGFPFIAALLPELKQRGFVVFFLDPHHAYATAELDPHGVGNLIHHRSAVDFPALLRRSQVYLRPTSTDGSSVAVLEALQNGAPVLASDAVPRPQGVVCYRDEDRTDFLAKLDEINQSPNRRAIGPSLTSCDDYLKFVKGPLHGQT